jgi:hypothetical protein
MNNSPEIFLVSTILLVPFLYGTTIPDVCAVPPSSGYSTSGTCGAKTTNPESGLSQQTCCWKQRTGTSAGPGPEVNVCQTCYQSDIRSPLSCSDPVVQAMKLPGDVRPQQGGEVFDEPSTSPKFGGRVGPQTGDIIENQIISGNNASNNTGP